MATGSTSRRLLLHKGMHSAGCHLSHSTVPALSRLYTSALDCSPTSAEHCQTGCILRPRLRNMATQLEPRWQRRLKGRAQNRESREHGSDGRLSFVIPPSRLDVPKRADFSRTQFRDRTGMFGGSKDSLENSD